MPWIIQRMDQKGGYVALPGSKLSYTRDRLKARLYTSREAAQADCCSNERPVQLAGVY